MNILSLGSHGTLEYDQLKMWTNLGYSVFSPGGYERPGQPGTDFRPAIPTAPDHPALRAACVRQRERYASEGTEWAIDWAKADLADELVDWADTVIIDCYPDRWFPANWAKIKDKRLIWRTIGQSNAHLETEMTRWRREGIEIVRYSPAERRAFEPMGVFAGEDAVIRFGKDPADWYGWTGEDARVLNLTQHNRVPHTRDEWVNWSFWEHATKGLPAVFAGPNSEFVGGLGALSYEEMRTMLRQCRVFLWTGTQPASYTLGLMEALMTGIPVVSIGPGWMWIPDLMEGHEFCAYHFDNAQEAHDHLWKMYLDPDRWDQDFAAAISVTQQARAIELFGIETIGAQWKDYLGE